MHQNHSLNKIPHKQLTQIQTNKQTHSNNIIGTQIGRMLFIYNNKKRIIMKTQWIVKSKHKTVFNGIYLCNRCDVKIRFHSYSLLWNCPILHIISILFSFCSQCSAPIQLSFQYWNCTNICCLIFNFFEQKWWIYICWNILYQCFWDHIFLFFLFFFFSWTMEENTITNQTK